MKHRQKIPTTLFTSFALLFALVNLDAQQQYILKGEIRDNMSKNEPVPMASVTLRGSNISTITDANGRFVLKINPADLERKLIVTATGYSNMAVGLEDKSYWSVTIKNFQVNFWLDKIKNVQADTDNDKVPDEIDKCPDQAGTADNYGCPAISTPVMKKMNWDMKNTTVITKKNTDGQERETDLKQLLYYEVNNTRIIPTQSSEKLILALNPKLKDNAKIKDGETIRLPELPAISAARISKIDKEYETDVSYDEKGQFQFVQLANKYEELLAKFPPNENRPVLAEKLLGLKNYLVAARNGPYKKLRKADTDLINNELQAFVMHYFKTRGSQKLDSAFAEDVYNTVTLSLKPYFPKKVSPILKDRPDDKFIRSNGPAASITEEYNEPEYFESTEQSGIAVNFYVYTSDGKSYDDSFWVYCLTKYYYDKLVANQVSLTQLDGMSKKCEDPASVSYKYINPTIEWYFVAVTKITHTVKQPPAIVKGSQIRVDKITNDEITYKVLIYLDN